MAVYLVDFENVRSDGLKGVEQLSTDDKVVIFYSKNANSITFDVHELLSKSAAEIETYRILRGGHNSLDFQLSTYLGYLVMENSHKEIVIISKDKGFLCVTNFWEENRDMCNCTIKLCRSIRAAFDNIIDNDIEDGLSGNFIERLSGKDGVILSINGEDVVHEDVDMLVSDDVMGMAREVSRETSREASKSEQDTTGQEKEDEGSNVNRENQEKRAEQNRGARSFGRPPGPKKTNFSTNIFTKSEPYYRVPNPEVARTRKNIEGEGTEKNEPWKQKSGDKKPWKPTRNSGRKKPNTIAETSDASNDVESSLPMNRLINKAMSKIVNGNMTMPKEMGANVKTDAPEKIVNPQNPTSKNKIFAAEVKLNIDGDVRELINGKYDESYVKMLVDTIGMSTGKQHFYKMMVNKVGQEEGLELYRLIKGHYVNLKRK